jgi:uncharacterized membrane protein YagU involved in acid resistance
MFEEEVVVIVLQLHVILVEAELLYLLVCLFDPAVDLVDDFLVFGAVIEVFVVWVVILPLLHHSPVDFDLNQV